jgi:hypothetical protein
MNGRQLDLSIDEIDRVVSFIGYGRPAAPVWFIGIEEGLGDMSSAEAVKNLKARTRFESIIMDLRQAHHARLWENGSLINWDIKPPKTQVWQYMGKIMRAYNNQEHCCSNLSATKDYVKMHLGRSCPEIGQTFLTELSPIPAAGGKDKQWIDFFRNRDSKLDHKMVKRKEALQFLIKANPQSLVICYGCREQEFSELLDVQWELVCPKVFKARSHRHLFLPFFGNGQISHALIMDLFDSGLLGRGECSK